MQRFKWLAWGGFAITAMVTVGAFALLLVPLPGQPFAIDQTLGEIFYVLGAPTVALVGAVVAASRRENPIGWVMIGIGLSLSIASFVNNYTQAAFWTGTETLRGGLIAGWLAWWIWVTPYVGLVLILHLFPTGSFLSRRWKWIGYGSVILLMGAMIVFAVSSPIQVPTAQGTLALANPIGLYGLSSYLLSDLQSPGLFIALNLPTVAALCSVLVRFVRASGIERLQIKWFLYSASVFLIIQISNYFISSSLIQILTNLLGLALPIAIGIAILRYRLYAIDILIRRTLTYAIVASLLLIVYFGSVIFLQQLFASISGQRSELITVISTLAIAALFLPLRNRVRDMIDKRFNRKKYDAQKVLAQFARTVRDETDLEKLTGSLVGVVNETMQPRNVSIWLKKNGREVKR